MNVIEFRNVWKKYRKGEKFNSLRDAIPAFLKNAARGKDETALKEQEFWAVKDVDFDIAQGEVVGILGPNGAGKSTILKLLSRIIVPNKGAIKIHGRLSALIEVTAGFHPELTGRENVYLNGTILGMKKREIDKKFDQIVDFSGIAEFIDTPVKRYSSGMYSRLGFSVAAHMESEILLVDEVLSVGDSSFQAKCAERMRELLKGGSTIILVSHSLSLIQSLCKRAILVNHGEILKDAATEEVLPFYENIIIKQREADLGKKIAAKASGKVSIKTESLLDLPDPAIRDASGQARESFTSDDELDLIIRYDAKKKIMNPVIWVDILRPDGVLCCACVSSENQFFIDEIYGKGSIKLKLGKLNLAPNIYLIKISFCDRELIHSYAVRHKDVLKISVGNKRLVEGDVFIPKVKWEKA